MKKKTMAMLISLVFILVCAVGGTLAWLTATSGPVTNTFTTSDINITLTETWNTDSDGDDINDCWTAQMVPGHTISKDPKVTVKAGSEACYLFVKVDKSDNFDSFMEYTIADGWTQLTGEGIPSGVYYCKVSNKVTTDITYSVLANDQVTVKGTVTKEMMNGLNEEGATNPTLTFTAYASQLYKDSTTQFTPAQAWANAQPVSAE